MKREEKKDQSWDAGRRSALAVGFLLLFFLGSPASLQSSPRRFGDEPAHRTSGPVFVTIQGKITQVKTEVSQVGQEGIHLLLKTQSGILDVHVGPVAFLTKRNFKLKKGDEIEVTGLKLTYERAVAVLAQEIKKNGKVLLLRDSRGVPLWSKGRKR